MGLGLGACLPDPEIRVPDLAAPPAVVVDMAVPPKMDGPSGDLGTVKWVPDAKIMTKVALRAAWVADAGLSEIFVVGQAGTILHKSGSADWTVETSGTASDLYGIAARSANEVYAVGRDGTILRRSGGTWSQEGRELGTTAALFAATVLDSGEILVVGDQALVARRQPAGVWTAENTDKLDDASLRAVWGSKADEVWAVGAGATIARRGAGGVWDVDTVKVDAADKVNLFAVTSAGGVLYAAGEYGKVLGRTATGWKAEATIMPTMAAPLHFYGLYAADGDVLAVGAGGVVERRSGTDKTWALEASGLTGDLYGVTGAGLRSAVTVGAQGAFARRM